eukprot:TRINITY_DN7299_c0_g1_i1.p1 TRINITY_DN7299_c0_g1~~TRINITY_DN7299_c0_g1_i1.p1  ORF type:complete len:332 (-),score=57.04 TRINITY_DN7299_c0_g1_i1:178-1173(-)
MAAAAVFCILALGLLRMKVVAQTANPQCKRFDQIYANGKELCENMWGGAFKYESDEAKAYTMWFFDGVNPNDATARSLGKLSTSHDTCGLQYYHKTKPGPEPDNFTECHPWKDSACCSHKIVESYTKLKEGYGPEYHWDRCGPISQECERFFVQEACFYECDPNAGLYRKFNSSVYDPRCDEYATGYDAAYAKANACSHNAWQMHHMPIKASYCDSWYDACRKDKFCASDGGDFFSCAAEYKEADLAAAELSKQKAAATALEDENTELQSQIKALSTEAIVGIVVPSTVAVVGVCFSYFLIRQERMGKPMFGRLMDDRDQHSPQTIGRNVA